MGKQDGKKGQKKEEERKGKRKKKEEEEEEKEDLFRVHITYSLRLQQSLCIEGHFHLSCVPCRQIQEIPCQSTFQLFC